MAKTHDQRDPPASDFPLIVDNNILGLWVNFSILNKVFYVILSFKVGFFNSFKKSGEAISFLAEAQLGSLFLIIITADKTSPIPSGGLLNDLISILFFYIFYI